MNPPPTSARIAVLGGGLTGLTAAWHLQRAGLTPVVLEKSARVGGAIGALHQDGWLHELGPNSLLEGSEAVSRFIDELGLASRRLYAAPAAKQRYIYRGGRLIPTPASPLGFVGTQLFSWRAKFGLLGEPWRPRGPAEPTETVADFVVRRLGREFLDYAVNPFVGGVYAGDPARLSVRHAFPKLHALEQQHGSLLRGAFAKRNTSGGPKGRIFSFPRGLEELPQAMAAALGPAVWLETNLERITPQGASWEIELSYRGLRTTESFAAVICALPADALASLKFTGVADAGRLASLKEVEHPPVASVFTGYRRADVAHALDGFGVLVPAVERRSILGSLFSSTLFPERAPEGCVALTTFVGGTRNPETARLDESELLRTVQNELTHMVGVRAAPLFTHVQRWPRAIPQYTLGYERVHETFRQFEVAAPGIFIGGNARDGISMANCIESGRRLATTVTDWIRGTRPSA